MNSSKLYRLFFIILFAFVTMQAYSQDVVKDIVKINQAYDKQKKLSFSMRYTLYKDHASNRIDEQYVGVTKQDSSFIYSMVDSMLTVKNVDYDVVVDFLEKVIYISKIWGEEKEPTVNPVDISAIVKQSSDVKYLKDKNENKATYMLFFKDGDYEKFSLTFNTKTYFIDKLVFYFRNADALEPIAPGASALKKKTTEQKKNESKQPQRFEMTFLNVNTKPVFEPNTFTYDNYLERKDGKFVGKGIYADYQIMDSYSNLNDDFKK